VLIWRHDLDIGEIKPFMRPPVENSADGLVLGLFFRRFATLHCVAMSAANQINKSDSRDFLSDCRASSSDNVFNP
jgi:hypothetical protein